MFMVKSLEFKAKKLVYENQVSADYANMIMVLSNYCNFVIDLGSNGPTKVNRSSYPEWNITVA